VSTSGAHLVDDARNFAARNGGQLRQRDGASGSAGAEIGIDQMHASRPYHDSHLSRSGVRIVDLLVTQVLWGPESVESDGMHDHAVTLKPQPHLRSREGRRKHKQDECVKAGLKP
jgi:hypothetical protein